VGREAECPVTYKARTAKRKALLETDEIIVRGEPRIVVKRADLTRAEADGPLLHLAWRGGEMTLALGAAEAQRWARDIMNPKSRLDKLGVKAGQKVVLMNVDDGDLPAELDRASARVAKSAKDADHVFVQADDAKALAARVPKAAAMILPIGGVWIITPRGVDGVKDTDVMKVGKAAGLVDVKVVRFNKTHTALRFVVPKAKRS